MDEARGWRGPVENVELGGDWGRLSGNMEPIHGCAGSSLPSSDAAPPVLISTSSRSLTRRFTQQGAQARFHLPAYE